MIKQNPSPFMTPEEVSVYLRMTIKTVYLYIQRGEFPNTKKIRKSYLIPESDVSALLEKYAVTPKRPGRRIISPGR